VFALPIGLGMGVLLLNTGDCIALFIQISLIAAKATIFPMHEKRSTYTMNDRFGAMEHSV
jgi:hypothetical protein